MQMQLLLDKLRKSYPHLLTPFIEDYFKWADMPGDDKPFFYGKWSLKWALATIIEEGADQMQLMAAMHHILLQLSTSDRPEYIVQFNATVLEAFKPWKKALNRRKLDIDIKTLPQFFAGRYKFVVNNTPNNLTSLIFRHTNADAIVARNPETDAAAIILRVNSKINNLTGFKAYLTNNLLTSEPGWKAIGQTGSFDFSPYNEAGENINTNLFNPNLFINHGLPAKTPTQHTVESLKEIITSYNF